jgi:thiamine-phosphate pyrophosphorylase
MADKLPRGLYALIDDGLIGEGALEQVARKVLDGGAKVLQLRLKRLSDRPALALVRAVVAHAHAKGAVVLVNDRVDLALAGDADGAHVGEEDLPVAAARAVLGPRRLLGATTRSLEEIGQAKAAGADHVGLGPVFQSSTKPLPRAPLGLEGLRRIAQQSPLPVVAISGITLDSIASVAAAGAWCAAVASDLLQGSDPVSRARALQRAFFGQQ